MSNIDSRKRDEDHPVLPRLNLSAALNLDGTPVPAGSPQDYSPSTLLTTSEARVRQEPTYQAESQQPQQRNGAGPRTALVPLPRTFFGQCVVVPFVAGCAFAVGSMLSMRVVGALRR